MQLIYEKLKPTAFAPTKAYPEDAGWDVRSIENVVLTPGQRAVVSTGLAVKVQPSAHQEEFAKKYGVSWYLRVADKSGLASKNGIHIFGGVVDKNYSGELLIVVAHLGLFFADRMPVSKFTIKPGDKICQLVPTLIWDCQEAAVGTVGASDRGGNGFGSTGAK